MINSIFTSILLIICTTGYCQNPKSSKETNRVPKPMKTIQLKSSDLTVNLDPYTGLPYKYKIKGSDIRGAEQGKKITTIICRLKPRSYVSINIIPASVKVTTKQANFFFEANYQGKPVASFHLNYLVIGKTMTVTMQGVKEMSGFEFIEVSLADLATVCEEDGAGWMAHGNRGGEVVSLQNSKLYRLPANSYFGKIAFVLPVVIIGTDKAECVMEVKSYMDGTDIEIAGEKGFRHARIGTVQTYRVHGGRSYNMNDGGPMVKGNENTPNLLVGQIPSCRLDFVNDLDGNGTVDWLDGAKLVAKRMPPIPTEYFNDKFIYMIGGKYKLEKEPRTTFAQSEQLIKDIAMLTDYAPQLPIVSGWVYDGQDTGFPSEDVVNKSMGGYEGFMHLKTAAKKYNANVTVNVNYDDAYKSSPIFDTTFIAHRPNGKIWKSRDWFGDTSYIVGMAKFMQRWGQQRVNYSVGRYDLNHAILIDALSWYAIRNDWDTKHPASGYKNLVDGRYQVLNEFLKNNIYVISEQLRYPYIGKLTLSVDGVSDDDCPFGGDPIPFLSTIYKKSAIWGEGNSSRDEVQQNLFWNCRPGPWFTNSSDRNSITDLYYMTILPYNKIHNLAVESYEKAGFKSITGLSSNSKLTVDWMNHDYSVVYNGKEIAGHNATYCSLDSNRIAFYSRSVQHLMTALPAGWKAGEVVAYALLIDHPEEVPILIEDGKIDVSMKAGQPIIVYRNAAIAHKQVSQIKNE